ncbi:MAG TPA: LacI family DNA-binding transcriptional regulator [Candidatus Brocadiia bacterium]|nr:LacI family DNA-binding transcriptional regulator [Candidatus Brocadiia bacterium]
MASTLSDIAREVGLATSTVADILRGRPGYSADTRKRTLEAARRLDYTPNHLGRSLRRKSSLTIGVLAHLSATGVNNATLKAIAKGDKPAPK